MLEIRPEQPADIDAVRQLNLEAFAQGPEAMVVVANGLSVPKGRP
jgi:predicted N-acetyltransferase YhbS